MAPSILKKRKHDSITKPKPQRPFKKIKKQTHYSSSSSSASADEAPSDFPAIDLADSASEHNIDLSGAEDIPENNSTSITNPQSNRPLSSTHSSASDSDSEASTSSSHHSNPNHTPLPKSHNSKRNDPLAFSTAISSILSSKLPTTKRADPVLARSSIALAANQEIKEAHVEKLARQSLRAEKKALMEKGRVKDVLLGTVNSGRVDGGKEGGGIGAEKEMGEGEVGRLMEQERRLKKTAQRGVVKLFNAVRMAQVRGEEARKEVVGKGIVGAKRREEKVGEMSKKGFLELVASGGGGGGKGKGKMGGEGVEEA
ncbi:MAG: hypothetical protein L6R40_004584 [Gallowayella cf. fulva]|nr:MAG: hypothetical protein L6R40_004584 [Xanthomendoza cf. fulva]